MSTRFLRRRTLTVAVAALSAAALAAGCSTAETPSGSGGNMNHVLPSGGSVAGWVATPSGGNHASTATLDYIATGGSSGCAQCHGADLGGGEMAPGLAGGEFTSNWNDLSVGDLYERIRVSMPQSAPGSLTRQQNSDILAYVLRKMNMPTGTTEVSTSTDELLGIKFLAAKPGGN